MTSFWNLHMNIKDETRFEKKKVLAHAGARHLHMYDVQENQLRNNFPCKSLPDIADEPIFKSGISMN